jgi:hypothetical protein
VPLAVGPAGKQLAVGQGPTWATVVGVQLCRVVWRLGFPQATGLGTEIPLPTGWRTFMAWGRRLKVIRDAIEQRGMSLA